MVRFGTFAPMDGHNENCRIRMGISFWILDSGFCILTTKQLALL